MVWTFAEEGQRYTGDIEYEADRQEEQRKTKEKVCGCREGHAQSWCDSGLCK